jgi:hypothetical protein
VNERPGKSDLEQLWLDDVRGAKAPGSAARAQARQVNLYRQATSVQAHHRQASTVGIGEGVRK